MLNNIITLISGLEVRSLKIIRTGTIRKLWCNFLFAFHSNYGSILHHFQDKAKYWSKIVIFPYHLAFDAPVWQEKLEWWGYPVVKKILRICITV